MFQRVQNLLACVALAGLVLTAACQQRQEIEDDEMGGDTLMMKDTTMMAPGETDMGGGEEMGGMEAGAQVSVTNTMPHEMVVTADWGQGPSELGRVAPNETKSFDVSAPAGTQATLTASDAENTHSTSGSVTIDATTPATWTIQ